MTRTVLENGFILPIVETGLALSQIFQYPGIKLDKNWDGTAAPVSGRVWLLLNRECLLFAAEVPSAPFCNQQLKPGDYVEGLWEKDLAELFITHPDGRYQEFNLSPTGAWWSMVFSNPRVRETRLTTSHKEVSAYGKVKASSWRAGLSLPLRELITPVEELGNARFNAALIIGQNPRYYLSYATLKGQKPDFHQPQNFVPFPSLSSSTEGF